MEESGLSISEVANSGNIVIDSLLGYWYVTAQKKGIDFSLNIKVPMKMEFKGADICLILGNLLENAVEAAEKAKKETEIYEIRCWKSWCWFAVGLPSCSKVQWNGYS